MTSKYNEYNFETTETCNLKSLIFHLDLKGMPPVFERLLEHLELYAAAGYNAVLVEWEDMFPWQFNRKVCNPNAYTTEQINLFSRRAKELNLEVIPLIQSIGHLEFILGWPEFAHLREVPERIDGLNPALPEATELIGKLIDDILELLPEIKRFHLGGDEAYTLGQAVENQAFIQQHGKDALYMKHMEPLLEKLNLRGIMPMLWADMMHDWTEEQLLSLAEKTELVVWGYQGNPVLNSSHSSRKHIDNMHSHNIRLWAAMACKGADGIDCMLPDYNARMENARIWLDALNEFDFEGMIVTAWSRYDSTSVNCDPAEGALDCIVAGGLLKKGRRPEREDAISLLTAHGEEENFEKRRKAMAWFDYSRHQVWNWIIRTKQLAYLKGVNRYGEVLNIRNHYSHALRNMDMVLKGAEQLKQELAGVYFPDDIHLLINERLEPLQFELAQIEERIRQTYPDLEPSIVLP